MVIRHQVKLIEIGDLLEGLGHPQEVSPVPRSDEVRGDAHILRGIRGSVLAGSHEEAQASYAQEVRDELEALPVPCEEDGAGRRLAVDLGDSPILIRGHLQLALDHRVRPGEPHVVNLGVFTEAEVGHEGRRPQEARRRRHAGHLDPASRLHFQKKAVGGGIHPIPVVGLRAGGKYRQPVAALRHRSSPQLGSRTHPGHKKLQAAITVEVDGHRPPRIG